MQKLEKKNEEQELALAAIGVDTNVLVGLQGEAFSLIMA